MWSASVSSLGDDQAEGEADDMEVEWPAAASDIWEWVPDADESMDWKESSEEKDDDLKSHISDDEADADKDKDDVKR